MTKGDLLRALESIPLNAEITIGKCVIINEKHELTGILELSVVGFGHDPNNNELNFLLDFEHIKKCFHPKDVTLLKNIPPAEHGLHDPIINLQ